MKTSPMNEMFAKITCEMESDGTSAIHQMPPVSCLAQLESIGTRKRCAKNQILAERGKVPECCYLVLKGQVIGFEELPSGEELYHYIMEENAMLLEANVLFDVPAPIAFKTSVDSEILCIGKDAFEAAAMSNPHLMLAAFHSIADKFFEAMDELREIKCHSATWRMCKLLLSFAERYGVAYDGKVLIQKKMSIQMMTSLLGVNRATTVRSLHMLRDLGLLENINGYYCVRSMDALRRHQEMLGDM